MNNRVASCFMELHQTGIMYDRKATIDNLDYSRLELQLYLCVYHGLGSSWHSAIDNILQVNTVLLHDCQE